MFVSNMRAERFLKSHFKVWSCPSILLARSLKMRGPQSRWRNTSNNDFSVAACLEAEKHRLVLRRRTERQPIAVENPRGIRETGS